MPNNGPFTPGLTPCHEKCGMCTPPPPEPFAPGTKVCDQHCYPNNRVLPPKKMPPRPTGYLKENQFRIVDGYPYLVDQSEIIYGVPFRASEGLETKLVQKPDASGLSIDAVLDCTNSTNTNFTLLNYLTKVIEASHDSLNEILPILKNDLTFRINYVVTDRDGAVILDTFKVQAYHEAHFHPTEIKDFFVESFKNIFLIELPDFGQYGDQTCTLTITNVEVFGEVIDTFSHLEDPSLNDFYAFHDNYTKIYLNKEKIDLTEGDGHVLLATCDINKSFFFKAAITTRFKFKYTAYMSDFITTGNTFNVWSALKVPTNAVIAELQTKVDTLDAKVTELTAENVDIKTEIAELTTKLTTLTETVENLVTKTTEHDENIESLISKDESHDESINDLITKHNELNTTVQELDERVSALEATP